VLAIGQALYEKHKLLTYPRSDSRYLPQDQQGDVPDVLSAMVKTDPSIAGLVQLVDPERKCRVFNDSKVTSHHGIIPTFQAGSIDSLNEQERNIYDIVRRYYLAQFLPAHEYLRSGNHSPMRPSSFPGHWECDNQPWLEIGLRQ
jgi:DNA topoisomerase-3